MIERSPRAAIAELTTESCHLAIEHPVCPRAAAAALTERHPASIVPQGIDTRAYPDAGIVVCLSREPERNLHAPDRTAASTVKQWSEAMCDPSPRMLEPT
jgi:hypothetical protein